MLRAIALALRQLMLRAIAPALRHNHLALQGKVQFRKVLLTASKNLSYHSPASVAVHPINCYGYALLGFA